MDAAGRIDDDTKYIWRVNWGITSVPIPPARDGGVIWPWYRPRSYFIPLFPTLGIRTEVDEETILHKQVTRTTIAGRVVFRIFFLAPASHMKHNSECLVFGAIIFFFYDYSAL
jgi:hypothetical protein